MPIQCKVDIPAVPGLDDNVLTVGREFYLNCTGDWPKTLNLDKLQFAGSVAGQPAAGQAGGDENLKYELKLLHFDFRDPQQADLKVTSYLAIPHKLGNLILTDGTQNLELGPVEFQVASVLPKNSGEKVEPYGPMGPALIPVPLFYWMFLLVVLLAAGFAAGLRLFRLSQRRKMLERLKEHDAALSPLQQFHQSMRKLQRANAVFYGQQASNEELQRGTDELFRMFKVYLSRRLRVPAFEWNEKLILKDIRKYHPQVYQEYSRKLGELYTEFKKAQSPTQKLQAADVVQLSETLRKNLEGVERQLESQQGGRP